MGVPPSPSSEDALSSTMHEHAAKWRTLEQLVQQPGETLVEFSAAGFSADSRAEAAAKLISNHIALLKDITNPSPTSQLELVRLPRSQAKYVDMFLLEAARRLVGRRLNTLEASMLDRFLALDIEQAHNEQMGEVWALAANYLGGRLQDDTEQFKGRQPDMSKEAGRAFLAVCNELGEPNPKWRALRGLIDSTSGQHLTQTKGIAAQHPDEAREEAARKLILNHRRVLQDITNPKPETQTNLQRLPVTQRPLVDRFLIEMSRRLLGYREDVEAEALHYILEEKLARDDKEGREVWGAAATYLLGRIQSVPDQEPGRKPDMSLAAAIAFVQEAEEVAFGEAKFLPVLDGVPGPAPVAPSSPTHSD